MVRFRRRHLGIALVLSLCAFAFDGVVPATATVAQAASSALPNRFDPASRSSSVKPAPAAKPAPASGARRVGPARPKPSAQAAGQPAAAVLDPLQAGHLTSSDGALELDVPAGAVS